jgi:hypothetical protein
VANTPGVVYPLFEEGADIMYVPRFVRLKFRPKREKQRSLLRRKRRLRRRQQQEEKEEEEEEEEKR